MRIVNPLPESKYPLPALSTMAVYRVPEDEVEQERLRRLRNLYASQRAARHQRRGSA